ncbi:MAG: DNA alkylation repair protein [Planctomycetota bacterium]|nr:DNA alkylation repair protein [Planctomycetota bacterium]
MTRSTDMLRQLKDEMAGTADPEKARLLAGFFKTGPGEYGEGDVFLGINVPGQREVAKKYKGLSLAAVGKLLKSGIHEHRLTALIILTGRYGKADAEERERIFEFYLANAGRINNWDLVDVSAPNIVGEFLLANRGRRGVLGRLARSKNLWERRIAVLATGAFIRAGQFGPTLRIAKMLLRDEHDLIHKAIGWMLREVGKRDQAAEEGFLAKQAAVMPRTMLRYAIERFSPRRRAQYMGLR